MPKKLPPPKTGFTLIELLVVIAVLGILSTVVVVAISPGKRMSEARDAQRKLYLSQMREALEGYFTAHGGRYPVTPGWWGECSDYGSHPRTGANGYIPNLAPDWLKQLPTDPNLNKQLCGTSSCYLYYSNGTDYKLLAHCIPENYPADNPFYDPQRPTWAWAVWSSDGSKNW